MTSVVSWKNKPIWHGFGWNVHYLIKFRWSGKFMRLSGLFRLSGLWKLFICAQTCLQLPGDLGAAKINTFHQIEAFTGRFCWWSTFAKKFHIQRWRTFNKYFKLYVGHSFRNRPASHLVANFYTDSILKINDTCPRILVFSSMFG